MKSIWRGWIALAAVLAGLIFVAVRLGSDPDWRAGLTWILRSWFRPGDADAGWQQHPTR